MGFRPAKRKRGKWQHILSLFDLVIESSKVGARKPEPRFYQLALEQLGIQPGKRSIWMTWGSI